MTLLANNCSFSEFGTRRRRSFKTHELVVQGLVDAAKASKDQPGALSGTSNVSFLVASPLPLSAHGPTLVLLSVYPGALSFHVAVCFSSSFARKSLGFLPMWRSFHA